MLFLEIRGEFCIISEGTLKMSCGPPNDFVNVLVPGIAQIYDLNNNFLSNSYAIGRRLMTVGSRISYRENGNVRTIPLEFESDALNVSHESSAIINARTHY